MAIRKSLPALIASLGLALATQSGFAASTNLVSQDHLDPLHDGASATEVTQALGTPESPTQWMDGKHSMVFDISSHSDPMEIVYVDLDSGNAATDGQTEKR
jgi:outer membrane protein assembly factor BamE (lipoprotein component of BamABCDE complex)